MDDFLIDYFDGGIDHNHEFDHDLHGDLDLELVDHYDDGPFAPLPHRIDLIPQFDYHDYDLEYHGGLEHGADFVPQDLDRQSTSSASSSEHPYSEGYESSVSESVDRSIGAPGSRSDTPSEVSEQQSSDVSDDDSEEEEVLEAYGVPYHARQHISDGEGDESDGEEYGSLPDFDDEPIHDHPVNTRVEDPEDEEGYLSSEVDDSRRLGRTWEDPLAEVESDDEPLVHDVHEADDSSQRHSVDDLSDGEVPAYFHDVDVDTGSEGQSSDIDSDEAPLSDVNSDDEPLVRRRLHGDPNHIYSDEDDEDDESGDSASSLGSSASDSPSEASRAPPSPPGRYFAGYPREFQAIHNEIEDLNRERQRLQENLRHLRGAHQSGIPHLARRANAHNGIDYFLDHLPVPQRDAHGLLAQMEMDLERDRQRRRAAPSPIRAPPRRQQQREQTIIDLTGDSPPREIVALPDAPRFAAARRSGSRDANPIAPREQNRINPRRNNLVRRAPSFARSDGSLLGQGGADNVIDLTGDVIEIEVNPRPRHHSPRPPRAPRRTPVQQALADRILANNDRVRANAAWGAANMNALLRHMPLIPQVAHDYLHRMQVAMGGGQGDYEVQFIGENRRPDHVHVHGQAANFENPLADNPIDFNYGANGFNQEAARPKPAHIAPPEPREGFTRGTGEDTVVICPSCEEELKYDPDESDAQPPPAKKARTTKKDREEHHFWAVKACGHVYCRSCYENRRPSSRNPIKAAFEMVDKKIICAVEDCKSDVSTKTAWVGIFL